MYFDIQIVCIYRQQQEQKSEKKRRSAENNKRRRKHTHTCTSEEEEEKFCSFFSILFLSTAFLSIEIIDETIAAIFDRFFLFLLFDFFQSRTKLTDHHELKKKQSKIEKSKCHGNETLTSEFNRFTLLRNMNLAKVGGGARTPVALVR